MKKHQTTIALLSCIALLLALLSGCGSSDSATKPEAPSAAESNEEVSEAAPAAEEPTTLIFGADTEMTSISPFEKGVQGLQSYQYAVYENLFIPTPDGGYLPCLAESYEWVDDNTLVLELREGVKFHDGSDFTAEDVMASIAVISQGKREAPRYAAIIQDECYSEGDYTLVLKTTGFVAPLLSNIARVPICDKDWLEGNEGYDQLSNGTGPYMLKEWNMGVDLVIEKNPNYWNTEDIPYFDTAIIKFFNDATTAFLEFEAGNLDVVYLQTSEDINYMLDGGMDGAYVESTSLGCVIALNMSQMVEDSPFKDINLRKAFAHAIDWETMITSICGNSAVMATSIIASSNSSHVDIGSFEYNPELAKEYLEQYKTDNGITEDIVLSTVVSAKDYNVALCEAMQAYLAEIGITLEIDGMQHSEFNALAASGGVVLTINQLTGGADSHSSFLAMERGSGNMTAEYTDETICNLIAEAAATKDEAERAEIYAEIQQLNYDGYWAIPMYEGLHYFAARDNIQGMRFPSPDFQLCLQDLYAE